MKKTIVLLAGYPATGKSYLCNKILEKLPDFLIVSQDDMKEKLFDQYGFDNMEEKVAIENQSWEQYYEVMEEDLKKARKDRVFITHSGCDKEVVDEVKNYLKQLDVFDEIYETRAGGVISSHCGPGTLGVLFIAGE